MYPIDLHCDTAMKLYYDNEKLFNGNCSVNIEKLKKSKALAQVFANFIELDQVNAPFDEFLNMHKKLMSEINENSSYIEVVRNLNELDEVNKKGKIGAFLAIEEGEVLEGKVENVKKVYDLGIRFITLTWNFANSIGYPNKDHMDKGLTDRGFEIVAEMEKLGIIPDCSHLSDKGFYDLVDNCKKPFIATHSNARAITGHVRNLTDEMIVALANKGGVMGLNFYSAFLGNEKVASIDSILRHAKHIKNVGGIDVLALGTDFDGIDTEVEIKDIGEMNLLRDALFKEKFTNSEIDKVFNGNVKRVIKECL